jgi:fructose-bisphosphate aldolase class II
VIVSSRSQVLEIYAEAGERRWALPCFCSENLTTTEAVLSAADEYGKARGLPNLPVILAITCLYSQRTQCVNYTHTRRWDTGLKLFTADANVLCGPGGPFAHLRVMLHLDHIQHDEPLVTYDLSGYASINFDASVLPFEENLKATAAFVEKRGRDIVVEGACDEVSSSNLTSPERAKRYFVETGADYAVANLGTEHRASGADLQYHGGLAREIRDAIGHRLVLHGASSVPPERLASLYGDGICKVNLWTALERGASEALLGEMTRNAVKIAGPDRALSHFTTLYRQGIVFETMKSIVREYLDIWYT